MADNETKLTNTPAGRVRAGLLTERRSGIAFNRLGNDGRIGIWVMREDGTVRVQKTFGLIDFFPDWQPI